MKPKKLFIPLFILLLAVIGTTASAQRFRSVGFSGGGRLPHGGGYSGGYRGYGGYGGRGYGGGYIGHGYGGYGGGRYYGGGYYGGGYGRYGLGFGLGLGLGLGFGYPYGYYGYGGYPYSPYYSPYGYPPVYAQPPVMVQPRDDDYYDDRNYQQQQPTQQQPAWQQPPAQQPQDDHYDYSRPVNPDSLTYQPGTNRGSPHTYSTKDKVWVKPHWKHTGDGWIWIEGYWK